MLLDITQDIKIVFDWLEKVSIVCIWVQVFLKTWKPTTSQEESQNV